MTLAQTELYGSVAADLSKVSEILAGQLTSEEAYLQEMVGRLSHRQGKMLRPALVLLAGRTVGRCADEHYILAALVEMVHLASLVHDDVIDEAESRRKMPSLNRMMGNEGAVLLGDYVMTGAFALCSSLRSHAANQILCNTCREICLGELMQVAHRRNFELTEAQYLDIIAKKTASLLSACGTFGGTFGAAAPQTTDMLTWYGHNLGMAFQIADDMLDLVGTEEEMGKTLGRDLEKGELTLPLIRFLATADGSAHTEMISALSHHPADGLGRIRQLLQESDALAYCGSLAQEFTDKALAAVDGLPPSEAKDCMAAVAEFVLSRRN
ncbi:MAG: polyprenyl synthetase family protein [Phycisphaerae bacterium]|nr:polyprenyl synthetase family protein [Phycisphaerae bacterium]